MKKTLSKILSFILAAAIPLGGGSHAYGVSFLAPPGMRDIDKAAVDVAGIFDKHSSSHEILRAILPLCGIDEKLASRLDADRLSRLQQLVEDTTISKNQLGDRFHELFPHIKKNKARSLARKLRDLYQRQQAKPGRTANITWTSPDDLPAVIREKIDRILRLNMCDLVKGVDYDRTIGRSVYIDVEKHLGHPLNINGRLIREIKVKGVCFNADEDLKGFTESLSPFGLSTITTFKPDGSIDNQVPAPIHPVGGMLSEKSEHEYLIHNSAYQGLSQSACPLGHGEFEDIMYGFHRLGFLILGITNKEENDLRSALAEIVGTGRREGDVYKFFVDIETARKNRKQAIELFRNTGKAVREFHDRGFIHGFLHMGNIMVGPGNAVRISDFETVIHLPETATAVQEVMYRANSIRSFLQGIETGLNPLIPRGLKSKVNINLVKEFFTGYYGGVPDDRKVYAYSTQSQLNNLLARIQQKQVTVQTDPFLAHILNIVRDVRNIKAPAHRFVVHCEAGLAGIKRKAGVETQLNLLLNDPDVADALIQHMVEQGIELQPVINVHIRNLAAGDQSRPAIDVTGDTITINLDPKSDTDLLKSVYLHLVALGENKPLTAEFTRTEFASLIPKHLMSRAIQTACWDPFDPDAYDGGRSVTQRLEQPVEHNGVFYNRVKIKGVVYKNILQPRPQSFHGISRDGEIHDIRIPGVDSNGRTTFTKQLNPQGGLEQSIASNEIAMMQTAFERGITLDIPLGYGIYHNLAKDDIKLAFVISLIPARQSFILEIIEASKQRNLPMRKNSIALIQDRMTLVRAREDMEEIFFKQGKQLREAHDRGIFLAFPHWDNIYIINGTFYWKDFSETQDIQGISSSQPARALAFRAIDISQALMHMSQLPFFSAGELAPVWRDHIQLQPDITFLRGYFYDRQYFFTREMLLTQEPDIVQAVLVDGLQQPVASVQIPFIPALNTIVQGLHDSSAVNTPRTTLVYPYLDKDSPMGRTLLALIKTEHKFPLEEQLRNKGIWIINFIETPAKPKESIDIENGSAYIEIPSNLPPKKVEGYIERAFKKLLREIDEHKSAAKPAPKSPDISQHNQTNTSL